jgi:superfamily II DNA/RNA helicase
LLRAVTEQGYTQPTPIQAQAIPVVLAGKDLLGAAQTGTGKTAGFTLPLLQRLSEKANASHSPARHPVRALIVTPTRELAQQVCRELMWLFVEAGARIATCVGGMDPRRERNALQAGAHIVVGTPGRLCRGLNRQVGSALTLSATVDSVSVQDLYVTREALIARAKASGRAGVAVKQPSQTAAAK